MAVSNSLLIQDLSLQVSLGCSAEERATLQEVRFSLELHFSKTPQACVSDQLSDTVCYAELSKIITTVCEVQSYQTVEHLACRSFEELRKSIDPEIKIKVTAHKIRPPVPSLKGGVFFTYGDLS
jgi:dihydroneopterin aldolase